MNEDVIIKTQQYLFASEQEMKDANLPSSSIRRLLRLRDIYTFWLNNPKFEEKVIVAEIKHRYKIQDSVAYDDVRVIKACLGNLNKATPDYYRWLFIQRCEEGFKMARANNDANAFARVLNALGKYTRLDKDEGNFPDYSMITPQQFDISADPEVAGYKRVPNVEERARKLLAKFIKEQAAAEPEYEEIKPLNPSAYETIRP